MPYFATIAGHYTNRFLGMPETPLSPQFLLLPLLDEHTFNLFNICLLYAVGFLGLLLMRRRYGLSWLPFTALFLLFNFNGYFVSRVALGHTMWYGYFFLPYFHLLVMDLLNAPNKPGTMVLLAGTLFVMELQGSFHLYVWCLMYVLLLAAFSEHVRRPLILAAAWSAALCAFRFIPAAVTWWGRSLEFQTGYPSLGAILDAFTVIRDCRSSYTAFELGWWELDCFIDIVGVAMLVFFAGYYPFRDRARAGSAYFAVCGAAVCMFALSFGHVYGFVSKLPLPFFSAERISSRFIILPVTALLFIAVVQMQRYVAENPSQKRRAALSVCLVPLAWGLYLHSVTWRLHDVELFFWKDYRAPVTRATIEVVSMQTDGVRLYVCSIWASMAVTAVFAIHWCGRLWRSQRKLAPASRSLAPAGQPDNVK